MAGSITTTVTKILDGSPLTKGAVFKFQFDWTSDASGDVDVTAFTLPVSGFILRAVTSPGGTTPTDNYDVVLNDSDTCDLMGGELANRSSTLIQQAMPKIGNTYLPAFVSGDIDPIVSNAGNAKTGTLIIYFQEIIAG